MPDRRTFVLAAGGVAVALLALGADLLGIADLPFYTKGEPREAVVVLEMAGDGGLILPLRNGDEIPSKPPLFHWLGLLSSWVLGEVTEFSTRLPSALLAIALTLTVYTFAGSVGRIRCGWLAAISLLFSFEWLRAARTARVDMTFSVFVATALLTFAWMERTGSTRNRRLLFWGSVAAATLAKGPAGLLLPLLVIAVHVATRRNETQAGPALRTRARDVRDTLLDLGVPRGGSAVAALTGLWYAAAWWIGGEAFVDVHLWRENVFRVLDAGRFDSGHQHGLLYLPAQFVLGAFPWSLSLPAVAWWLWRGRPLPETERFLVVWFVVLFAVFCIPESKRGVYLLPAYPAGALLFGLVLGPGPEGDAPRRLAAWGWLLGSVVLASLGLAGLIVASQLPIDGWILPHLRAHEASEVAAALAELRLHAGRTAVASVTILVAAAAAAVNAPGAHWLRASVPLVVALAVTLAGLVAPVERAIARARSFSPFVREMDRHVGNARVAFAPGTFDYGVVFYAQRHIPRLGSAAGDTDFLLAFERPDAPPTRPVLLRSEGTGVRGRTRLLLLGPPNETRTNAEAEAAD